jgi:hypothetical protein
MEKPMGKTLKGSLIVVIMLLLSSVCLPVNASEELPATPSILASENQQSSSLKPLGGEFRNIFGIVSKVRRHIDNVSFHAIFLVVWGAEAFEHSYMPYIGFEFNEDYVLERPFPGIIICHLLFIHYD